MQTDAMGVTMIVDATITIGNMVEIGVLVIGGIISIATLKGTIGNMKTDLTDMKAEIKKLGEIMVDMADIRGEIKATRDRVTNTENDIRDLRYGRGFIAPRSEGGINGQYP